jgi:hypothetical protein
MDRHGLGDVHRPSQDDIGSNQLNQCNTVHNIHKLLGAL